MRICLEKNNTALKPAWLTTRTELKIIFDRLLTSLSNSFAYVSMCHSTAQ